MAMYSTPPGPPHHFDDTLIQTPQPRLELPELSDFTQLLRDAVLSYLSIGSDQISFSLDQELTRTTTYLIEIHAQGTWQPIGFEDACKIARKFFDDQDISCETWCLEHNDSDITAMMLIFSVVLSSREFCQRLRQCAADRRVPDDEKFREDSARKPGRAVKLTESDLRVFFAKEYLTDVYFEMILRTKTRDDLVPFEAKLMLFMNRLHQPHPLYRQHVVSFMQRERNALGLKNHIVYGGVLKAQRESDFQTAFDFVHSFYKCLTTGTIRPHDEKWIAMGLRIPFSYEFTNRPGGKEQQRDPVPISKWEDAFGVELEFVEFEPCSWDDAVIAVFNSAQARGRMVPISLFDRAGGNLRFAHADAVSIVDRHETRFENGLDSKNQCCVALSKFFCLGLWNEMVSVYASVIRDVPRMYLTLGPIRFRVRCAEDISKIFCVMSGFRFRVDEGVPDMPRDKEFDDMAALVGSSFDRPE